jgi:hypothetical protein
MTLPLLPETIDTATVKAGLSYHDSLNPAIWNDDDMRLDVRVHLLESALAFYEFLDISDLTIQQVIFTGSNASYNYTKYSDCDVHIVVDFRNLRDPVLARNLFSAKKLLWSKTHDVEINGYPVELYVEDSAETVNAQGIYDLMKGVWVKHPSERRPDYDDAAVFAKADHLADEIDGLLAGNASVDDIADMIDRIWRMRQAGLEDGGEFSTENLAFKALRNLGLLDALFKAKNSQEDHILSLD